MNAEIKKVILEAMEYYEFYKSAKPYIKFANFLESIKLDSNKAIIESLEQGVNVILEGYVRDYMKRNNTAYSSWFDEGTKISKNPEEIAQALETKDQDKSKIKLVKSLYNLIAKFVEAKIDAKTGKLDESRKAEHGEELMADVVSFVLYDVIPKFDPSRKVPFVNYAARHIKNFLEPETRKELGIKTINKWKPNHRYEWQNNSDYGEVRYDVEVNEEGKTSTVQKVFRRIGPTKWIPEELRDIPPNDPEVSEYWRQQGSDRSKVANEVRMGGSSDDSAETLGIENLGTGAKGYGGVSADSGFNSRDKNPEEETSDKQSFKKIMDKAKNTITANVKNKYTQLNLSEDQVKEKQNNLLGYLNDRLEYLLKNTDNDDNDSDNDNKLSNEQLRIYTRELKRKYNIADGDQIPDKTYMNIINNMRAMGKEAFA